MTGLNVFTLGYFSGRERSVDVKCICPSNYNVQIQNFNEQGPNKYKPLLEDFYSKEFLSSIVLSLCSVHRYYYIYIGDREGCSEIKYDNV